MASRKPLSPPKRVTLAFVHRETGGVHKRRTFEFRNEFQAILKMTAWVTGMAQEGFTPDKYRLIAYVDSEREEPKFVISVLRRSGIEVHKGRIDFEATSAPDPDVAGVLLAWRGTKTPSKSY